MEKQDKIGEFLAIVTDLVWIHIVDPHLKWEDKERKNIYPLSFKILDWLLMKPLELLNFAWWFVDKRLKCLIWGCDWYSYHPFNTPEDCYNSECKRCGAWEEFGNSSAFGIIRR